LGKKRFGGEAQVNLIRLHAVVEGQTEETFVNHVLAPRLGSKEIFVDCHRITTGRRRSQNFRGGISRYSQIKDDLILWMKQDQKPDARFTTMVDLYRLPNDFPGYDECKFRADPLTRVRCLEEKLSGDLEDRRFLPYIQLHEFEALLFSDVTAFEKAFPEHPTLAESLGDIVSQFLSPEHINENPDESPSCRILQLVPDYVKPVTGILIAQAIGLQKICDKCAHFADWINRLEQLVKLDT
jgi:hypothetical protein